MEIILSVVLMCVIVYLGFILLRTMRKTNKLIACIKEQLRVVEREMGEMEQSATVLRNNRAKIAQNNP